MGLAKARYCSADDVSLFPALASVQHAGKLLAAHALAEGADAVALL